MRLRNATVLFLALAAPAAASPTGVPPRMSLRIATEGTYRPWNYLDSKGRLIGFDIDVANDICRRIRARCTIETQEWDGMIPSLLMRKFDMVISDMSMTPKRRLAIEFSIPYARDDQSFMTRDPTFRLSNQGRRIDVEKDVARRDLLVRQLEGRKVGVFGADSSIAFFRRYTDPRKVRLLRYASAELMRLDFVAGRIDLSLAGLGRVRELTTRRDGLGLRPVGPIVHGGLLGEGIGVGMAKGRPELKAAVDGAIAEAIRDGTLQRLSFKWMGIDLSPIPRSEPSSARAGR